MIAYVHSTEFVYQSGIIMKPVFSNRQAHPLPTRSACSTRKARASALRAVCRGRKPGPSDPHHPVIDMRIEKFGLQPQAAPPDVVNVEGQRYRELWQVAIRLMGPRDVTPDSPAKPLQFDTTLIGCCMLLRRATVDACKGKHPAPTTTTSSTLRT